MVFLVGLDEVFLIQVGVDLRGGNIGVTEEFLNHAQVSTAF